MKKRSIGLIATLIVLLFLALVFYLFFSSYQKDKKEVQQNEDAIKTNYPAWKEEVDAFSEVRSEIYDVIFSNTYYQTMKDEYAGWIELLTVYEAKVAAVETASLPLLDRCKLLYTDQEVKNKCASFRKAYEQGINYFVKDIEKFNRNIESYNTWRKEEGKEGDPLRPYDMKTKRSYLDYDQDGVYLGKE